MAFIFSFTFLNLDFFACRLATSSQHSCISDLCSTSSQQWADFFLFNLWNIWSNFHLFCASASLVSVVHRQLCIFMFLHHFKKIIMFDKILTWSILFIYLGSVIWRRFTWERSQSHVQGDGSTLSFSGVCGHSGWGGDILELLVLHPGGCGCCSQQSPVLPAPTAQPAPHKHYLNKSAFGAPSSTSWN